MKDRFNVIKDIIVVTERKYNAVKDVAFIFCLMWN